MQSQRMQFESELIRHRGTLDEKLEEANRRHQIELKNEKEKAKIEQEEWKNEFLRKQKE